MVIDLPNVNRYQLSELGGPLKTVKASGRKILLYLGRFHPKKGLVNLLKAWKRALNSQPSTLNPWTLAIAGWDEGGHESDLKKLVSDLGILTSVTFLGPQFGNAKMSCYDQCDAFVLPSFSEGFPMVVLEAWAYGKPVLMTPECNLPEGFESNAAIRIATDVENIEHGLRQLFEMSAADCQTMGERGKKLVMEKYSWPRISAQMKGVYDWVVGGGARPECVSLDQVS